MLGRVSNPCSTAHVLSPCTLAVHVREVPDCRARCCLPLMQACPSTDRLAIWFQIRAKSASFYSNTIPTPDARSLTAVGTFLSEFDEITAGSRRAATIGHARGRVILSHTAYWDTARPDNPSYRATRYILGSAIKTSSDRLINLKSNNHK
jgi:hypothetical protein